MRKVKQALGCLGSVLLASAVVAIGGLLAGLFLRVMRWAAGGGF